MADVILTSETNTQETLDTSRDTYFLAEGVLHYSSANFGTLVLDGFSAQTDYSVFVNGTIANFGNASALTDNGNDVSQASITIGTTGKILGREEYRGVDLDGDQILIVNNGEIAAAEAVRLDGADNKLFNNGLITGTFNTTSTIFAVIMNDVGAELGNTGTITGGDAIQIDNDGIFNNTGNVVATDIAINADSVNSAEVIILNNSGVISGGTFAYEGENGQDQIYNSGSMLGDIETDDSNDLLVNSGSITGDVDMHNDADTVINTGTITGSITLGNANDTYDGTGNSVVSGGVDGGSGEDTLLGGNGADALLGDSGNDSIKGGAGDDTLTGGTQDDTLSGGSGDDDISGDAGIDVMFGNSGNDDLSGGDDDDVINGNSGEDALKGGAGIDKLVGGKGNDDLIGGADRDNLFGGNGADVFDFNAVSDSINGATDAIRDFNRGVDVIDLVDTTGLNILFNGTSGFVGAGDASVYYNVNGKGQAIVRVDTDGDAVEDMRIQVNNTAELGLEDFNL